MSVTETPFVKKKIANVENKTSLSLRLPVDLYEEIRRESEASKKSLVAIVEEVIDQNASLQNAEISLATLMKESTATEKADTGTAMKILTAAVSLRHYSLVRLEAMRQNSKVRPLLNEWLQARYCESVASDDEWPENAAVSM